jgi:hypothetical protein
VIQILLGGKRGGWALLDDEDEWAMRHRWQQTPNGYVVRARPKVNGKSTGLIYQHREIMGFPDGPVDHINRNKLDNRRSNLRSVTWSENAQNRTKRAGTASQFRGVQPDRSCPGKWIAAHELAGTYHYIGYFDSELAAAEAALAWRRAYMPAATD